MTPPGRPPLFVQVDVDGLWAVRAVYGRPQRETFDEDPVWEEGVPALRRLFESLGIPAAFFIVGRDLDHPAKAAAASALWRAGFEAGNHSDSHLIGLTRQPVGRMVKEIRACDAKLRAGGAAPVGFRAPGYDLDARLLLAVRRCGYLYDASLLPTYAAPALRLATRILAGRWDTPSRQFGRINHGRAPRSPYFPDSHRFRKKRASFAEARLMEIPVGVRGMLRLPFSGGFLLEAGAGELRRAYAAAARRPLLLLLHGIDAVDCRRPIVFDNRRPRLGGFNLSQAEKLDRLRAGLEAALRHFTPMKAEDFVRERCR